MKRIVLIGFVTMAVLLVGVTTASAEEPLKLGMIGLDTSHVIAFARLLHDEDDPNHVPGGRVIAAYRGGSDDLEASYSRIDGFTERLETEFGVQIVDTIEELCEMVDAILLTSVDGRPHLEQARPVFEAGLPMFIDKPLAGSLEDAIAIAALGEEHDVPWFTSSAFRFYEGLQALKEKDVGEVRGAISYGPSHLEPTHPDLFWYGIHPTEALYTIMGTGCEVVTCAVTEDFHVVTGVWENGRVGTLYGLRTGATPHRVTVFGTQAVADQESGGGYGPLVAAMIDFFRSGVPPVSPEESIEIFAFMEAAHESIRRDGAPVRLDALPGME